MKPREIFLSKLTRKSTPRPATGSATSIVTTDLMEKVGVSFPEAHTDADKMARLATAGATVLGFDNVMPLYGVWHESAALGCDVDWGTPSRLPAGKHLNLDMEDDLPIPDDLLTRPPCAVPLKALSILKKELGDEIAVCGKAFGPWTLAYHIYGIDHFLLTALTDPDRTKAIMRHLIEVTVRFAQAQVDAGADAITLADHCTRDLCSPDAYQDYLIEIHQELHERIPCPLALHICGDTSDRIGFIALTGIECFHFDSKLGSSVKARQLAGEKLALMGGTDNMGLLRKGTPEQLRAHVRKQIAAGIDIIGPECAVPLDAPSENLRIVAEETKKMAL